MSGSPLSPLARLTLWLAAALAAAALAAPAPAAESVRIAYGIGYTVYLPLDVARANGYFRDEGLDVEAVHIVGTKSAQALIARSVDFSGNALDHVINTYLQGQRLLMVAGFTRTPGLVLVVSNRFKDQIRGVADLRGHPIGVTVLGAASDQILRYLLARSGVTAREINIVATGADPGPNIAALEQGQVHAVIGNEPLPSILLERGGYFPLLDLRTRSGAAAAFGAGDFVFTGLLARQETVQQRPDLARKVVNAVVRADRWIAGHSAQEIVAVLPPPIPKDTALLALRHSVETFYPDGLISRDGILKVLQLHRTLNPALAERPIAPEALYDMRFVERALGR